MVIQYSVGANFVLFVTNWLRNSIVEMWTVKTCMVTATIMVRVTVSYDCPVYDCPDFDCPDFDCVIKSCNQGTTAPDFLAHVYCRQTAGWINVPFGMDYGGT